MDKNGRWFFSNQIIHNPVKSAPFYNDLAFALILNPPVLELRKQSNEGGITQTKLKVSKSLDHDFHAISQWRNK